jgi:crossover junction endodeoxyribonuclease RuvC
MRILGVDPGLSATGYAILEIKQRKIELIEAGVIKPPSKINKLGDKLKSIYADFKNLLEEFKPEQVAIEELYSHYQHPKTAIIMGHCRGTIMLACAQSELQIHSFNATKIKKTVTGNGRASKEQVSASVTRYFNLEKPPSPADVTDAMAAAMTLANQLLHGY